MELLKAIASKTVNMLIVDPVYSNTISQTLCGGKAFVESVKNAAALGERAISDLRYELTEKEINQAVGESTALLKKGGAIYEASISCHNSYKC